MQYILTEKEFNDLTNKSDVLKRDRALDWCFEKLKPKWCGKGLCDSCPIGGMDTDIDYELQELVCREKRCYSK